MPEPEPEPEEKPLHGRTDKEFEESLGKGTGESGTWPRSERPGG